LASVSAREALVTGTKQPKGQLPVTMVQSAALAQLWCEATKARNSSFASHVARVRASADLSLQSLAAVHGLAPSDATGAATAELLGSAAELLGSAAELLGSVGAAPVVRATGGEGATAVSAAGGGELTREQAPRAAAIVSASATAVGNFAIGRSVAVRSAEISRLHRCLMAAT
jgi:hypothetical protein